jgi:hypothetical protein
MTEEEKVNVEDVNVEDDSDDEVPDLEDGAADGDGDIVEGDEVRKMNFFDYTLSHRSIYRKERVASRTVVKRRAGRPCKSSECAPFLASFASQSKRAKT